MSKAMVEQKQKERKFLEQLLDGTKVENYTIPVPIKAELRKYQQVRKHFSTCVACAWKYWVKERTGAREGDTRVSFSRTRFFLCPLLPSACYAG